MKTKILIAVLSIGLFTVSTIGAQEKAATKMDHSKMKYEQMEKAAYTCPMHADVKSDKPDSCSKCGMDLVKMDTTKKMQCCAGKKTDTTKKMQCCADKKMEATKMTCCEMAKTYTCSMHSEVSSDKSGECPKCGMKLTEKKMNMKKEDSHKGDQHK